MISFLVDDYKLPIIACFLLFFAMISYWIGLSVPKNKLTIYISKSLIIGSNSLLSLTLLFRWYNEGYFPLSNLYESLIFLCWGISLIQLILESKTKSRVIGAILTPILFFICGFSSLTLPVEMQKALPLVPSLQSNWLMMHVSMMMVSYAVLIIGSLLSILYLTLNIFQKKKVEAPVMEVIEAGRRAAIQSNSQISILETLDIWSYRVIGLGFPFLTIGIISGAVWANEAWGSYWSWDPKETWALITWIIFAVYLHSRIIKGWEGEKTAVIGTLGFFVIWICYLGVNFLGKGLHSYGWMMS